MNTTFLNYSCLSLLLTTVAWSQNQSGAHPNLAPEIADGLKVELSAADVADLRQWTNSAKSRLAILTDDVRYLTLADKRQALVDGFRQIIGQGGGRDNELLMGFTLKRALRINELVGSADLPGELQSLVSLLETSSLKAQQFFVDDQEYLKAIGQNDQPNGLKLMPIFGYEYVDYVLDLAPTFLNPKIEYQITRSAIGWFGNDLNSSRNALYRALFSEEISRISDLLNKYSATPPTKAQDLINSIRNLKFQMRERVLVSSAPKVNDLAGKENQKVVTGSNGSWRSTARASERTDSDLTVGEKVVFVSKGRFEFGTVFAIFADGSVSVSNGTKTFPAVSRDQVGFTNGCKWGVCVGKSHYVYRPKNSSIMWPGRIAAVFGPSPSRGNMAKVVMKDLDSESLWQDFFAINELSLDVLCVDDFCVGETALLSISSANRPYLFYPYKIQAISRDNAGLYLFTLSVEYKPPFTSDTRLAPVLDLGVTKGCLDTFCVGDKIVHRDGSSGEIKGFFLHSREGSQRAIAFEGSDATKYLRSYVPTDFAKVTK